MTLFSVYFLCIAAIMVCDPVSAKKIMKSWMIFGKNEDGTKVLLQKDGHLTKDMVLSFNEDHKYELTVDMVDYLCIRGTMDADFVKGGTGQSYFRMKFQPKKVEKENSEKPTWVGVRIMGRMTKGSIKDIKAEDAKWVEPENSDVIVKPEETKD